MSVDIISQFEREDRLPREDELFSLHEVIERRVSVHWDEAVAVIEEFCEVAIASSGETAPVPDLEHILIGRDGRVTLHRTRGDKSPTAAGRMLHALLSNGDVPMALRLFVTQSTAHDTHASLREFARGLAYFGREGRDQLIKDVYTRCAQAARRAPEASPAPPPLPNRASEPLAESNREQKSKRRPIKKWVLAAAALALVSSATWLWSRGGPAHVVKGNAARILTDATAVLADLGQQVRDAFGPRTAEPAAAAADSSEKTGGGQSRRRRSSPPAATVAAEPAPLISRRVSLPQSPAVWQLAAVAPNPVNAQTAAVDAQPPEPDPAAIIYSSADRDVEPPALTVPQLTPAATRSGAPGEAMNRMVIVVSPEGTVERVQLIEGPARLVDMMLLSGAKTWKFTPALRNGEPVRYRTVISWAALP